MEIQPFSPILQEISSLLKQALLFALIVALLSSCAAPKTFEYRDAKNIHVDRLGFDKTVLVMDLLYYNPNGFGVDLKQINCDVFVEKTYLGKFLLDTLMHVNRMSEFLLPSRIELDMKSIMKNGLALLMNKEVLVSVKGTARAGRAGFYKTVPFEYEEKRRLSLF